MLNSQAKNNKKLNHLVLPVQTPLPKSSTLISPQKMCFYRVRLHAWTIRISLFLLGLIFVLSLNQVATIALDLTTHAIPFVETQANLHSLVHSSLKSVSIAPSPLSNTTQTIQLQPRKTIDSASCSYNGIPLYGTVEVVTSFPDLKVKKVDSFPDLNVQWVTSFPDHCGQWKEVTSFPDFTIQYVDSFPDLEIKEVDAFPGLP